MQASDTSQLSSPLPAQAVASKPHLPAGADLIQGTGGMADLVRQKDWSQTPLGPLEGWPETLISTVNLLLTSPFSFAVYWGPEQILLYNDTYRPFLGEKHPAALGGFGPGIWEEAWPVIGHPIDQAFSDGTVTNSADVFIPIIIDGRLQDRYWTYCFYPIYERGRIVGVANIGHDSTPAVLASQKLKASEERTRLALTASNSVGIWDWDVTRNLVFADENFCRMYGVDPTEAVSGVAISQFVRNIHPEDLKRIEELIQEAIRTGDEYSAEYRLLQPDGSVRWASAVGRCSYAADGTPARFPGVTTDITDRKKIEAALLQTEKLAAVGRLAASIAHEINNPLESVTNLLYLARINHNISEVHDYLDIAERELRRVSVISNQTLRFYKQSTNARKVLSEELFESVLSIYQGRIINSRVIVEQRERARQPVECFDGEIRQVLNNLVGNAIDAMHPAGGRLLLRSRDATDWKTGEAGMVLTVADTGSGMAAHVIRKIFDAFYTTKGIGGTGLGLWVSKEIIDRHRGAFRVRSSRREGDTGTVFTLFLPLQLRVAS